jgi:Ca2+-binding RTX toxin-like protein
MEQLENRRLFAADVGIGDDYWIIEGTPGDDAISIRQEGIILEASVNGEIKRTPVFLWQGVTVCGHAGDDVIHVDNSVQLPTRLHGGSGDDVIIGSLQDDVISGGWGNDDIYARAGNDRVWGDQMPVPHGPILQPNHGLVERVETVSPTPSNELVPPASDRIRGGNGNDVLYGGPGNDDLFGEVSEISVAASPRIAANPDPEHHPLYTFDDQLYGEDGEDFLHGGPGGDYFDGGLDPDEIRAVDNQVDVILLGPGDTCFHDDIDLFVIHSPELPQASPRPTDRFFAELSQSRELDSVRARKIRDFYIDEAASQPGRSVTEVPTLGLDLSDFDDDWLNDMLEDLIDYPW